MSLVLRVEDGREVALGSERELRATLAEIMRANGGSSGQGRFSYLFGLEAGDAYPSELADRLAQEAAEYVFVFRERLSPEAVRLLDDLAALATPPAAKSRAPRDQGIGKIQRVHLREVWKHEALDFTTWLEHNPDVLSDALGITIANVERERRAGSFSADLTGEDEAGNTVVIENQLERSDHDHLGKVITYLAAFEAKTAIWIVSDPRPEHVGAITWLNESGSSARFFLVKVEAIRIGTSEPAPLLTLITGPSDETRQVGAQKQERAERHDVRHAFWSDLLDRARGQQHPHSAVSAGTDSWLGAGSGRSGVHFIYVIRRRDAAVQLVIEGSDADVNARIFEALLTDRTKIEAEFGVPLDWDRVDGRKRCAITLTLPGGGYADTERWPDIQDAMIEHMRALDAVLRPRIQKL